MATTTHVPVEVYLRSSYEPDAEYVDGKIEERPMGEFDHASWQEAIWLGFGSTGRMGYSCPAGIAGSGRATRYRVPDVTVLDRSQPIEQIITHPPLAVFEVLSPEDTLQRLKRKLEDYRSWASRKSGSSTPRTAPSIAMKMGSSCATTPSPTPKRGSFLT
jgi:Uma2 family endonuclease